MQDVWNANEIVALVGSEVWDEAVAWAVSRREGEPYKNPYRTEALATGRCMHCPPMPCGDCGEQDDRSCSCWVSIESLSLADKKALFASDGTFNIGINGEVTTS